MKINPLRKNFLFQFHDRVNNAGQFDETPINGFVVRSTIDSSAKTPRWCTVRAVGEDVSDFGVGQTVLLPALRWTVGAAVGTEKMWKSDQNEVVAYKDSHGAVCPLADWIIFQPVRQEKVQTLGLLIIVSNTAAESPRGVVTAVGRDVKGIAVGDIILYDDANWTDTVADGDQTYAFIRADKVPAVLES